MLTIRDLSGNEEHLTDFKELTLNRKVNGEKQLSLTLLPTSHNEHSFPMVEEESVLTFDNEEYVIKKMTERGIGNTTIKRVEAIHKFYVDMINKQQPNIHNGSLTFANFLSFVFNGTGYTFSSITDYFNAQSFENFGNDNRLALLQKGLERYKAEMEIVGNDVRFKRQVGNDTDFQFRYGHNIKSIERSVDTTNLSTFIRGKWEDGMTLEYRSPNADILCEIDAPTFTNEWYTSEETRLQAMEDSLQDTPEFSITIDFVDLRAAGYPWTVPNEGDRVYVIYEPMKDLLIETRILEIREVYNAKFQVIKTEVTLANHKKSFAGTMFDNVDKRLKDIVNDDGVIRYNVLDEAVRIATEALKSAQTELEFNNGIIARDKDNPNLLVLFNSAGVGISTDGGNTFKQAITSQGVVTDLLTAGQIKTNTIQIVGEDNLFYWDGSQLIAINPNVSGKFTRLNSDGLYVAKGAAIIERDDGYRLVIDGKANFDLLVQGGTPQSIDDTYVYIEGQYARTKSTDYVRFDFLRFAHTSRFLNLAFYGKGGGAGAHSYVQVQDSSGNILDTKFTNNGTDTNIGMNIDLGVPTGEQKLFYVYIKTTHADYPCNIRLGTKYLTG